MCEQQSLRSACAYAQSDQSICSSLENYMSVKLLTEHLSEVLSLKGGCTCLSESTLVKMPHCRKSHVTAHLSFQKSIDLMKIDIEAGEWPALPEMLSSGVLKEVKQLIMEFHSWVDLPPWNIDHRDKTAYTHHLQVLRDLYHADFRIFFFNRFPAKCCMYKDEFGIERFGCHEIHLMKVKT